LIALKIDPAFDADLMNFCIENATTCESPDHAIGLDNLLKIFPYMEFSLIESAGTAESDVSKYVSGESRSLMGSPSPR
jgi:hypothetical protein